MIYIGCSQWNYTFLKSGNPKRKDLLSIYSDEFNCVEINSTFYELPSGSKISSWKSKVNQDFRFCPKFPGVISHEKYLNNTGKELDAFIETVKLFGNSLGICFLQLSPFMFRSWKTQLKTFMEQIDSRLKVSIEFRPEWLADTDTISYCIDVLKEHKAGIVIVDGAETIPYLNKLKLTNPTAFIRFLSYEHQTDFRRIDDWINQISHWLEKGVKEIYFMLHFGDRSYKPEIIDYTLEKFIVNRESEIVNRKS